MINIGKNEKKQGIYRLYNKVNGKSYIGRSLDLEKRANEHVKDLNKNKHTNYKLQRDWNEYGISSFTFETLLEMHDMKVSRQIEKDFILTYKKEGVYNLTDPMEEWNNYIDGTGDNSNNSHLSFENEPIIKIQNEFISENSSYHLSEKELYLYSLLYMDKRLDRTVVTTLSAIHDIMHIKFSSQKDRNVKSLKEVFGELLKKNIITISFATGKIINLDILKASDTIRINFTDIAGKGHHTQVPYSVMKIGDNLTLYYIFVAVKRWENTKEAVFKCDYERFARILGVARSTAQRSIDSAVEKKIIYRKTGVYLDRGDERQNLQDVNEYKCTPF